MANKKKQHTVQKAYLEQWNIDNCFFIYDLKKQELHDKNKPKDIFKKNYIYNWTGKEKLIIDDLITLIEKEGYPIIKKIVKEPINSEEKYKLSRYISLQMLRIPSVKNFIHQAMIEKAKIKMIELFNNPEKKKKMIENANGKYTKIINEISKNPSKNIQKIFDEKIIVDIKNIREIWLQAMCSFLEKITKDNYNASWGVYHANHKHSFITSDNPVVIISQSKKQKNATKNDINFTEITFSLNPKNILLIKKAKNIRQEIYRCVNHEDNKSVREFNRRSTILSDRYIVSNSDKLLLRLIKNNYNEWKTLDSNKKNKAAMNSKGYVFMAETPRKKLINRKA